MSTLTVKCPRCGHPVPWVAEQLFRPFCSERCKTNDFGEWLMEEKTIPGESFLQEIDREDENDFSLNTSLPH